MSRDPIIAMRAEVVRVPSVAIALVASLSVFAKTLIWMRTLATQQFPLPDTKVSFDTFVQWIILQSSGLIVT